jgi:polyphosphate:AMP phosphotransferase
MFEAAELGRVCSKSEYAQAVPGIRTRLLKAQALLEHAPFPVIVLINGVDGAGKRETTNLLHEWLDARYLASEVYSPPTEEERERPEFWRFFRWLPPRGRIGLFLGNWYTRPILERARGEIGRAEFERDLARIRRFERLLTDDGAVLVKLWFHVTKRDQRRNLERLERDPGTRFRVTSQDWRNHERYKAFVPICEHAVRETSTGTAPWTLIEASDEAFRNLSAATEILAQLEPKLERPRLEVQNHPEPPRSDPSTIIDRIDLKLSISKAEYDARIPRLQARLNHLARKLGKRGRSAIFLFEGDDAAGKGGAIRRIVPALEAGQYRIIPVSAPSEEERAYNYLWRFYRHLPRRGKITIYDRSWYGRVLVERVEGFATRDEWSRAYSEINDFERELVDDGIVLLKFFLRVSSEEQLRRFEAREREPWKQHKITPEDYRNRGKRNQYEAAAAEMIARSSTEFAPFTLVSAEDKRYARVTILETICSGLEAALSSPPR